LELVLQLDEELSIQYLELFQDPDNLHLNQLLVHHKLLLQLDRVTLIKPLSLSACKKIKVML
jgi:hypothetical protein